VSELFKTEIADPGIPCEECRCTFGIHLVTCSHFHCTDCGQTGASPEHHGGCPTKKEANHAG